MSYVLVVMFFGRSTASLPVSYFSIVNWAGAGVKCYIPLNTSPTELILILSSGVLFWELQFPHRLCRCKVFGEGHIRLPPGPALLNSSVFAAFMRHCILLHSYLYVSCGSEEGSQWMCPINSQVRAISILYGLSTCCTL